jgi:hypothetical protein
LLDVAAQVEDIPMALEIALCHDLLEDTHCDESALRQILNISGYNNKEVNIIIHTVNELTDVYTAEDFPNLNRKERKKLEAHRLWTISYLAQTIKYADLIDNTRSIVEHDKTFAKVYLQEKKYILLGMDKGLASLHSECCIQIQTLTLK